LLQFDYCCLSTSDLLQIQPLPPSFRTGLWAAVFTSDWAAAAPPPMPPTTVSIPRFPCVVFESCKFWLAAGNSWVKHYCCPVVAALCKVFHLWCLEGDEASAAEEGQDPCLTKACLVQVIWEELVRLLELLQWRVYHAPVCSASESSRDFCWCMYFPNLILFVRKHMVSHIVFRLKLNAFLYVSESIFTHKVINSEINSITSVCYIVSCYKN
jgi:hypothetical protein